MNQEIFNFFLVVPPGFEALALGELNIKYQNFDLGLKLNAKSVYGGVEFEAPLELGCQLNHLLKIPSKILLRLTEFRCRDFPKLFNNLKKVKFKKFIPNSNFKIEVSSQKSRLLNEKRILKTATDALKPQLDMRLNITSYQHSIFIRFYEDLCKVSLDTSGELLFKRGYKTIINKAPLRENLAAGIFFCLIQRLNESHFALVDPMCGSGTFLLESQAFFKPIMARKFAYQEFPFFKNRKMLFKILESMNLDHVYGFDIESIEIAKKNWKNLESTFKSPVAKSLFTQNDVFGDNQQDFQHPLVLVCNPPYGKLLKLPKAPKEYYAELLNRLSRFEADIWGCILPRKYSNILSMSKYFLSRKIDFLNGGIPVSFCMFERKV